MHGSALALADLEINFENEEGMDMGGLRREFFNLLFQEVFADERGLFERSKKKMTYQPHPLSSTVPEY
jgi:hypothetical protein